MTLSHFLNIYVRCTASHQRKCVNLTNVPMICKQLSKESERCLLFAGSLHPLEQYQQSGILSQLWHNIFTKLQMTIREKAQKRQDFKKCYLNFVKNLTLMADVLNELTNLSETLPSRNTTLPKACALLNAYTKRMKSLISSPGEHSILAQ